MHVVPLHVVVGGTEHAEGVDIDPAAVAAALRSFTPVSTSRPGAGGVPRGLPGGRGRRCRRGRLGAHLRRHVEHDRRRRDRRRGLAGAGHRRRLARARHGDGVRRARRCAAGRRWRVGRRGGGCRARDVRGIHRRVLRRHPGVPAPWRADRQGRRAGRVGAVDQADPRPARRAHRAAGAGAHLDPGHRAPRGPRRRGGVRAAGRRVGGRRRRPPPRLAGARRAARRTAAGRGWATTSGCGSSSSAPWWGRTSVRARWRWPSCPGSCRPRRAEPMVLFVVVEVAVVAVVCFFIGSINPATLAGAGARP